MSRNVQILLLCACAAPWLSGAAEESMEERKRRIARKYLRERADITYSEEQVPGDAPDLGADELLASEQFGAVPEKIGEELSEAQAYRPAAVRQRAKPTENPNWLLAAPADETNPYAAPFDVREKEENTEDNLRAAWEGGSSPYADTQREDEYYRRQNETFSRQPGSAFDVSGQQSVFSSRSRFGESAQEGYSTQQGRQLPGRYDGQAPSQNLPYSSAYGQALPYGTRAPETGGEETPPGVSPYWSSTPGLTSSPARQEQSPWSSYTPYQSSYQAEQENRQQQWGNYTPYQSPYQTQQENRQQQQQQQWGSYTPGQEYKRQDSYEEWKRRTAPQYDPTSADSYTQEMMPQTRR